MKNIYLALLAIAVIAAISTLVPFFPIICILGLMYYGSTKGLL